MKLPVVSTREVIRVLQKVGFSYAELEGCQTQGDSLDEVMVNIKEAIELYLETLSEDEIKASLSKEIT